MILAPNINKIFHPQVVTFPSFLHCIVKFKLVSDKIIQRPAKWIFLSPNSARQISLQARPDRSNFRSGKIYLTFRPDRGHFRPGLIELTLGPARQISLQARPMDLTLRRGADRFYFSHRPIDFSLAPSPIDLTLTPQPKRSHFRIGPKKMFASKM